MSDAHRRKKQPAAVRHQLLDVAARQCVEHGLHVLTLDAVAKEAGVSKGGLLHHFPSKQALLDALCEACLEDLDKRIDAQLEKDKILQGRFSRAYLMVMVNTPAGPDEEKWNNLGALFISDDRMRARWDSWLTARNARHKDTDDKMSSLVVRLASDGLWLSDLSGSPGLSQVKRKKLIAHLIELSRQAL